MMAKNVTRVLTGVCSTLCVYICVMCVLGTLGVGNGAAHVTAVHVGGQTYVAGRIRKW